MTNVTTMSSTTENSLLSVFTYTCTGIIIVLCVAGVIGNSLSMYVYTLKNFRMRSINVLLLALSLIDLLLLVLAVPVFASTAITLVFTGFPWVDVILYVYPVTVMLQCASVWLLVVITIERWVAVCRPFLIETYCTRQRSIYAIISVMLISIAYNMIRFWEYEKSDGGKGVEPNIKPTLRADTAYLLWYQNVATSMSQFVLPVLTLSVLNLSVVRTMQKATEQRQMLSAHMRREYRTANMMTHVVIVFVCCYGFSFALNVMEIIDNGLFDTSLGLLLNDINNVLVITNSASTFLFYLRYSTRYRNEIHSLFLRVFRPQAHREKEVAEQLTRLKIHSFFTTNCPSPKQTSALSLVGPRRSNVDGCHLSPWDNIDDDGVRRFDDTPSTSACTSPYLAQQRANCTQIPPSPGVHMGQLTSTMLATVGGGCAATASRHEISSTTAASRSSVASSTSTALLPPVAYRRSSVGVNRWLSPASAAATISGRHSAATYFDRRELTNSVYDSALRMSTLSPPPSDYGVGGKRASVSMTASAEVCQTSFGPGSPTETQ